MKKTSRDWEKLHGELCSLISGVSGYMQLLRNTKVSEEQIKYIELSLEALVKMRTLLNGSIESSSH